MIVGSAAPAILRVRTGGEIDVRGLDSGVLAGMTITANLMRLVELIPVLELPESAGRHYGRIRAALAAAGTPLGNNEMIRTLS